MSSADDLTPAAAVAAAPDRLLAHWQTMKRVLVATDGSITAADAIGFAVEYALGHQAELIFVHVIPTIDFAPRGGLADTGIAVPHEPSGHDHAVLERASAVAAEYGVNATTALLGGSTADEIAAYADSNGVDLIVIGSRGLGPISGALLGSVVARVLHTAKQPVIVIRCAMPPHPLADAGPTQATA
jgi:nucleotide-binding universal stress UspA family protein